MFALTCVLIRSKLWLPKRGNWSLIYYSVVKAHPPFPTLAFFRRHSFLVPTDNVSTSNYFYHQIIVWQTLPIGLFFTSILMVTHAVKQLGDIVSHCLVPSVIWVLSTVLWLCTILSVMIQIMQTYEVRRFHVDSLFCLVTKKRGVVLKICHHHNWTHEKMTANAVWTPPSYSLIREQHNTAGAVDDLAGVEITCMNKK